MAISEEKRREYSKRLLVSRMRILCNHGFYGLLLMHMTYAVDEKLETACTDGKCITFGTDFLSTLSDSELDFVMMHEILHAALGHVARRGERDPYLFNIACDIVVNSNILKSAGGKLSSITLKEWGESMHEAPDGKEGHEYSAELVYEMLKRNKSKQKLSENSKNGKENQEGGGQTDGESSRWDNHDRWGVGGEELPEAWTKRVVDACERMNEREAALGTGNVPAFAERLIKELLEPKVDWRAVLSEFIEEELSDYSFSPPDRRFSESPFLLPDFNDTEECVKDILFMIDTSGSMSYAMIRRAYSEVKGAIDRFGGRLCGWLGFFDASVSEPVPFSSEEEFRVIKPIGGGGTSFNAVFDYVRKNMEESPPAGIVILTDGFAPFPNEEAAQGIPVLWLINNNKAKPTFGRVTRIPDR